MQDWKIVNSSKYSLGCCTYVFHRCRFVLTYSVLAYSILRYFRFPYSRFQSPLLFLSSSPLLSPPLPLEVGPLHTARVFGGALEAPQPTKDLVRIWSQKVQLWWQHFLFIFLNTNVIFCTKASLISYGGSNSSQGGAL